MEMQYLGPLAPSWSSMSEQQLYAAYTKMVEDARGLGHQARARSFTNMPISMAQDYCAALFSTIHAILLGQQAADEGNNKEDALNETEKQNEQQEEVVLASTRSDMSIAKLLEQYNEMVLTAADYGVEIKTRKSFRTHADAVRACEVLETTIHDAERRIIAAGPPDHPAEPVSPPGVEDEQQVAQGGNAPAENAAIPAATSSGGEPQQESDDMSTTKRKKKSGRPAAKSKATTASRSRVDITQVIHKMHTEGNPKRAGSDSHEYWKFYRDGMTVAQYIAKFGDKPKDRTRALQWLRWDVKHKLVKLSKAS
jgi:hypothetical protein